LATLLRLKQFKASDVHNLHDCQCLELSVTSHTIYSNGKWIDKSNFHSFGGLLQWEELLKSKFKRSTLKSSFTSTENPLGVKVNISTFAKLYWLMCLSLIKKIRLIMSTKLKLVQGHECRLQWTSTFLST